MDYQYIIHLLEILFAGYVMDDLYKVLGIERNASIEEIKSKYLFLVKAYHPDRYQTVSEKKYAEDAVKEINYAYSILGNATKKKEYDENVDSQRNNDKRESYTNSAENSSKRPTEILKYFDKLINEWKGLLARTTNKDFRQDYVDRMKVLSRLVLDEMNDISRSAKDDCLRSIHSNIEQMRNISLVLGFEYEFKNQKLEFDKDELIAFIAMFPILAFEDVANRSKVNISVNPKIKLYIEEISSLSLKYATEEFIFGWYFYQRVYKTPAATEPSTSAQNSSPEGYCQNCGRTTSIQASIYRRNIGMVFRRRYLEVQGVFCAKCQEKLFWQSFMTNLFLGWWGVISFCINPFLIILNVFNYVKSWGIRRKESLYRLSLIDWKLIAVICVLTTIICLVLPDSTNHNSSNNVVISRPTLVPTTTAYFVTSKTTNVEQGLLFAEDFSDRSDSDYSSYSQEFASTYYNNNLYLSLSSIPNYSQYITIHQQFDDAIIRVFLLNEYKGEASTSTPIVLWRLVDNRNHYALIIDKEGYVYVIKRENGENVFLFQSKSPIKETKYSVFSVIIQSDGEVHRIFVGGKLLTTIVDSSFASGDIGIGVISGDTIGKAAYDYLQVYSLDQAYRIVP